MKAALKDGLDLPKYYSPGWEGPSHPLRRSLGPSVDLGWQGMDFAEQRTGSTGVALVHYKILGRAGRARGLT